MSVDSYLELFTTLFGWHFYGVVWDVLVATGIVYLPLLGILIDHWRGSAEEAEWGSAAPASLRKLELDLFLALAVVVLAGQPATLAPLSASTLAYAPPQTLVNPAPATATPASSGSTYGTSGFVGSPETVNVPVWWYGVLATSSGLNHAIVAGLPNTTSWRVVEQQARLATIADPRLRQEVSTFYTQCFVPARSKFEREAPTDHATAVELAANGTADVEWLGSHVYRTIPGYYDSLRPTDGIIGWAYDAVRDTEYDPASHPEIGRPTCKEWWDDPTIGIQQKLIAEADATAGGISGLVVALAPGLASDVQKDAVAKAVLSNAPPVWSSNDLVANNVGTTGILGSAANLVKGGLAAGGVLTASALFSVAMTVILQALPMIQALMLLGLFALLPLIVVMSRYSVGFLVTAGLAIFTVKFWTVLWYLAMWVDQNLIQSMYPDANVLLQVFTNPGEHDVKRLLLNMLTTSFYLGLPLLWSGMMGWVGVRIGQSLEVATNPLRATVHDAGKRGGAIGSATTSRIFR